MGPAADAGLGVEQFTRIFFGHRDQPFDVVDTELWIDDEDVRQRSDEYDRGEGSLEIRAATRHYRSVDRCRDRCEQERVAILGSARDIFGGDHTAGPRPVLHRYGLSQNVAELVSDNPRRDVAARTGGKSDDQPDRAAWIIVAGLRENGKHDQRRDRQAKKPPHPRHVWSPSRSVRRRQFCEFYVRKTRTATNRYPTRLAAITAGCHLIGCTL